MKKCPNCGAEISEEARYCIHCMTPLIPKQEAKEPKRNYTRSLVAIGVASLILAASVLLILFLPKLLRTPSDGPRDPLPANEDTQATESASEERTREAEVESSTEAVASEDEPETKEDPCRNGHAFVQKTVRNASCAEDGEEVLVCTRCNAENSIRIPALGHQFQAATCTQPQTCTRCGATVGAALGHLVNFGVCSRCGNEVANAPRSAEIADENARHEAVLSEIDAEYAAADELEAPAKPVFTRYNEAYPPKKTSVEYYSLYGDYRLKRMNAQSALQYLNPSDPNYETKRVQQENIIEDYAMLETCYQALSDAAALYEQAKAKRADADEKLASENTLHESNLAAIDDKYR